LGFGHLFSWGFVLQALALVHFFRRRPEGYWFFVIMFLPTVGALIRFLDTEGNDVGAMRYETPPR